jgi:tryptophan halogenase
MVIIEVAYLLGGLQAAGAQQPDRAFANQSVGAHWDFLRWFLAIHYKYNRKADTQFWRDCRATVDVSGIQPLLDRFREVGPWHQEANLHYATGDPAFTFEGLMIMLLGQQAPCPPPTRTSLSRATWDARVAASRALVGRAYGQAEALELLRQRPELLQEVVTSPSSWLNRGGELLTSVSPATGIAHPQPHPRKETRGPYDHLLDEVGPQHS